MKRKYKSKSNCRARRKRQQRHGKLQPGAEFVVLKNVSRRVKDHFVSTKDLFIKAGKMDLHDYVMTNGKSFYAINRQLSKEIGAQPEYDKCTSCCYHANQSYIANHKANFPYRYYEGWISSEINDHMIRTPDNHCWFVNAAGQVIDPVCFSPDCSKISKLWTLMVYGGLRRQIGNYFGIEVPIKTVFDHFSKKQSGATSQEPAFMTHRLFTCIDEQHDNECDRTFARVNYSRMTEEQVAYHWFFDSIEDRVSHQMLIHLMRNWSTLSGLARQRILPVDLDCTNGNIA